MSRRRQLLTPRRLEILEIIKRHPRGITLRDLAEMADISSSATVKMHVDRLIEAGRIRRDRPRGPVYPIPKPTRAHRMMLRLIAVLEDMTTLDHACDALELAYEIRDEMSSRKVPEATS